MAALTDPIVQELLSGRYIATLASENADGSIHMVAVWYLFDKANVYVATSTRSHKARNLACNPKVSLMIDSRDEAASRGSTIAGQAQLLTGDASRKWNDQIHRKYMSDAALRDANVGPVFAAWDDCTIQITPASVIALDMREADRQVFNNAFEKNPAYMLSLAR